MEQPPGKPDQTNKNFLLGKTLMDYTPYFHNHSSYHYPLAYYIWIWCNMTGSFQLKK